MNEYLSEAGDVIIGGTFAIHVGRSYIENLFTSKPADLICQTFDFQNYRDMRAMTFAIEEINSNPDLLPNISLGFQIFDTCVALRRAVEGTFWLLSGGQGQGSIPNYQCHKGSPLAGVIGDSGSTSSILMAHMLGLYRYSQSIPILTGLFFRGSELSSCHTSLLHMYKPFQNARLFFTCTELYKPHRSSLIISYFSTSPLLSDRNMFPSFFRTIPSDEFQYKGLAQLVSHFGWTWVGLLATDNDYGQFGVQVVQKEIIKVGACVAFIENILTRQPNRNAPHLARVIRESTAKAVLVLSTYSDLVPVVEEMVRQNVTGKIWVASESWSTSILLSKEKFQSVLVGTIGFAIHSGQMPAFSEYLNALHPSKSPNDTFIREFWEQTFSCKWWDQKNVDDWTGNTRIPQCTGREKLGSSMAETHQRSSLNVYSSVYAFAWALQSLIQCKSGSGPFHHGVCANISSFHPWQLLHYIKSVNFETKDKIRMFFDAKGNPPALYDIVNWHLSATGTLEQVKVGSYDSSAPDGKILTVDSAAIIWVTGDSQVPLSVCSPSCPSGFRKMAIPGQAACCFECVPCPQGEISNQTDAVECHRCSWDMWPSLQHDRCLPKAIQFLSYKEPLGINIAVVSFSSSMIPIGILGVFIYHKKTPIVRANNWFLSCLLLVSLSLCFLCSLAFIGYPHPKKCLLRQVAFGIVFALCISCVLAKTITVVIAFKATKLGSGLRKWTGTKVSYFVIGLSVLIQLCVCVTWLSLSPPFQEYDIQTQPGVIIFGCNKGSPTAFWCMLGYLGFLASVSFIVAFLVRRLPDSFNEAKFITFSMLAFLSVWVSYIPASLSAHGKHTVAMEIFAILSSSWAIVVCIFVPKCFIILFRPQLNTKKHLLSSHASGGKE
ncbi:extracellular calcium-sensing receptor-like [Ascaphus truei]|uniref:extracellular calcium-sensing receptor-like n=1 Tax=Ascaphus truei TaxID=8439 RepID=UPI003F592DB4